MNISCIADEFKYYFSKNKVSYKKALSRCQMKGGNLATNLTGSVIRRLATYCLGDNTQKRFFWIDLRHAEHCQPKSKYLWKSSNNCLNDTKLTEATSNCSKSVAIDLRNLGNNTVSCGRKRNHFLCQFPVQNVHNSTGIGSFSTATQSLGQAQTHPTKEPIEITSFSTTTQSLGQAQSQPTEGPSNTFIIAGIGGVGGILLLLFIALICFLCKRTNNSKKYSTEEPFILEGNVLQKHINHFIDGQHS